MLDYMMEFVPNINMAWLLEHGSHRDAVWEVAGWLEGCPDLQAPCSCSLLPASKRRLQITPPPSSPLPVPQSQREA